MEKEDLNKEHTAGGVSPSSKSRSKRGVRAYHPRNRGNNGATRIPQSTRPNAQKHGVFSACSTIPGEDPREFQELLSGLIDEWQPAGRSEEDAVFSLADLMWRKRRAQRFFRTKLIESTYNPRSPTFDERRGLDLFILGLRKDPETAFEQIASRLLTAASISHLKQKFPRSKYQSTSEWAEAVITEIKSILLPAAPPSLEATEPGRAICPSHYVKSPLDGK